LFNLTSGKELKQAAFDVDDVARLSTAQTITGAKTFTTTVSLKSSSSNYFSSFRDGNNDDANGFVNYKSRGTFASPATVVNNDNIGNVFFEAHDGTNFVGAARIASFVDGTPGTADMPGRIVFLTRPGSTGLEERMRIAADGRVGIGTTSPNATFSVQGNTNLGNSVAAELITRISGYGALDGANRFGSYGQLIFNANNSFTSGARRFMLANATATFSIIRSVDSETDPSYGTGGTISSGTADFQITNTGNVLFPGGGNVGIGIGPTTRNNTRLQIVDGIGFPATQVPSTDANTLDDYEEGTWTPTVQGSTTAGTGTYTQQVGYYTKIGNVVHYHLYIVQTNHTGTGNIRIAGLPFTTANKAQAFYMSSVWFSNLLLPADTVQLNAYTTINSTFLNFEANRDNATPLAVAIDTAFSVYITGMYQTL
jgi:hypothetical protein